MKYVYEFIGTFFLVFTVGMTALSPDSAGLMAPLAIGSALAVMVFAGAHISGGHYNPAVSFAVYLRGLLTPKDLGLYWIAQLLAAVVAAALTIYFKNDAQQTLINFHIGKAFLAEFLFTFALCFVVLNVATAIETKGNSYYGLAIGFTVLVGAYAVGAISGGAFNPAVALGITIMKITLWKNIWVFIVANLLGGACAAGVFKAAHPAYIEKT
jgi:aquaporin Z